jgi:predicted TPR repeat methyltransferase
LGHALRKQGKWEAAEAMYNRALGLVPRSAATLTSLAFTAQLRGDNTTAVELYHVALGLRPDDRCVCARTACSLLAC